MPNALFRQFHRWLGIAFVATILLYIGVTATGRQLAWVTYLPLLPLLLSLLTGLYLFVLPYLSGRRRRKR